MKDPTEAHTELPHGRAAKRHPVSMANVPGNDIAGRLFGLLVRLGDRLDLESQEWTHEFIDHNELGLALETMAEALSELGAAITDAERRDIIAVADEMSMDGRVRRALALCPTRP